ncbi:MAG: hypothetical protein WBG30_09725 [Psychrilyobacter sp.]|uniref:hypothetical protein n=1 Tax=Psychrilyobacter sp. TaxID=2586924 RepID=UPI003C772745
MKKTRNKFTRILLMIMLMFSAFLANSLKTYSISSYPIYLNGASNNHRVLPEGKPEYYNVFTDKIFVGDEKEVYPDKIVADIVFINGGWLNDENFIRKVKDRKGAFAEAFISTSGLVVNDVTKLPRKYVNPGEVAFSIVLSGNSRGFLGYSTFSSLSYWKKVTDSNAGPNYAPTLVENTHYGITNKDAFSIAKTTGTSLTTGVNFGISGGGLSMGVNFQRQINESLTNTYGREISLESSHDSQIRHQFMPTNYPRRVAIYQYCEVFKANIVPKDDYIQYLKRGYNWKVANSRPLEIEIKTSSYAAMEVAEPVSMIELTPAGLVEPELKDIFRVDETFGGINKPSTSTEIIEVNQTTSNYVVYDFEKSTFIMNGPVTLDVRVNIKRPGSFRFTVYNNRNEAGSITNSTRILHKGINIVTLNINNLSDIKNIFMFRD